MTARRILLVDDDEDLRGSLKDQLSLYDEFDVFDANTAAAHRPYADGLE